jgi:hypothetical protein
MTEIQTEEAVAIALAAAAPKPVEPKLAAPAVHVESMNVWVMREHCDCTVSRISVMRGSELPGDRRV